MRDSVRVFLMRKRDVAKGDGMKHYIFLTKRKDDLSRVIISSHESLRGMERV